MFHICFVSQPLPLRTAVVLLRRALIIVFVISTTGKKYVVSERKTREKIPIANIFTDRNKKD
jgi:hypothetical protein